MNKQTWFKRLFYTLLFLTISTFLFSWPGYRNGSDRSGFVSGDKTNSTMLSKMWECQVSTAGGGVGLPVIFGGCVYIATSDGRVVKVGLKGGGVVGSFSLRGAVLGYDSKIYFATSEGHPSEYIIHKET